MFLMKDYKKKNLSKDRFLFLQTPFFITMEPNIAVAVFLLLLISVTSKRKGRKNSSKIEMFKKLSFEKSDGQFSERN